MPAIYLFQRRTLLGGDDLQLPALLTIAGRVVQGALFILPQCYCLVKEAHNRSLIEFLLIDPDLDTPDCQDAHMFPLLTSMYLGTSIAFGICSIILEFRLYWWSCQGTPTMNTQPRTERVERLLEYKLFVFNVMLALIVATFISAAVFGNQFYQCQAYANNNNANSTPVRNYVGSKVWWITSFLLVLSQSMEIFLAVIFWERVVQADKARVQLVHRLDHHELMEELWADRCNWMCRCLSMSTCFVFGGQDLMRSNNRGVSYYGHLSKALADYLETRGTLDVVPTDLVTGLLILQRLQRQRILQARLEVVRSSQSQLHLRQRAVEAMRSLEEDLTTGSASGGLDISQEIPIQPPKDKAPQTLRSRVGSVNDLRQPSSSSTPPTSGNRSSPLQTPLNHVTRNESPVDVPELARLVATTTTTVPTSSPFATPTYRVLRHAILEESRSNFTTPPTHNRRQRYYQSHARAVLNPHNPIDCLRLQEGARMAKFALSIYTWMLYLFVHPITGIPRLLCRSCQSCAVNVKSNRRRDSSLLDRNANSLNINTNSNNNTNNKGLAGDNFCGWHKHSLLLVAGLDECDLVYAQFINRFSLVPYCILLDHATQSVVVSIRGTLSVDDLMTDVHMDPEPMDRMGQEFGFDGAGQYCHAGVVACARNVYDDLQEHGRLDELLSNQDEFPEYKLRLVGHSLGAGVCTLLGYMLRSRYPTLQVFNYSPPGCTMTWELATRCEAWTTTFVLDTDIVPRLSVPALERLRNEVLELVGKLKVPKYQVVESFWNDTSSRSYCSSTRWDSENASNNGNTEQILEELTDLINSWLVDGAGGSDGGGGEEMLHTSAYHLQLQDFWRIQEERKQARGNTRSLQLFPPGRMIHLLKTGEEGGCGHVLKKCATCCTTNSGFQYTPVYIANDDLDEIVVSPTMATDHFVDRMVGELNSVARSYSAVATGELIPSSMEGELV